MKKTKHCIRCGSSGPFYKDKNRKDGLKAHCAECHKKEVAAWQKKTNFASNKKYNLTSRGKATHRKNQNTYQKSNHGKAKQRAVKVANMENFLRYKMGVIRIKCPDTNIDPQYLLNIFHRQNGLCNLTKIRMTYNYNDPRSASVDRIDSSKGYYKRNIQLVCRAINMAKQSFSNMEIKTFIEEIKEIK